MQFLFVVLMSVLVGSSALPHVMQAPNRPSFSLRKNTNFSIVAIPKLFQTVASLERKIASIEEEQNRKKMAIDVAKQRVFSGTPTESEPAERASESALRENEVANQAEKRGSFMMENLDLQSCICKQNGVMDCKVFFEASCSHIDEFAVVTVKVDDNESVKNFRCKEQNHFSGSIPVSGGGVGIVKVVFMDQQYEQRINLINYCGQLEKFNGPTEDD